MSNFGKQYFLMIQNMRTGSTWLELSLNELNDVYADYELKWEVDYPLVPIHRLIEASCLDILKSLPSEKPITGAKLLLDAQNPYRFESIERFLQTVEPNIRLIHVTRNYYDILLSITRGCVHVFTEIGEKRAEGAMLNEIHENREFNLKREEAPINASQFTFHSLIVRLVTLFMIDLIYVELSRRAELSLVVDYENINNRFYDIVRFVSSRGTLQECKAIIDKPIIRKLKPVNGSGLPDNERVMAVATVLNKERDRAIKGETSLTTYFSENKEGGMNINLESLVNILNG